MTDQIQTEAGKFDGVAKTFHWLMAAIVILMLVLGQTLEDMPADERREILMGHSGLGLSVFVLVIARLLWRRSHPAPAYPDAMSPRMQQLAKLNVYTLYGLMVYMPMMGFMQAATYVDFDVLAFGVFNVTALLPSSEATTQIFHVAHGLGAILLSVLVIGHIGAAIYHLAIKRDKIFQRMWPRAKV
jgi:cytochrome b561